MSELSTVAIKDGHRGHLPNHRQADNPGAERADRISRLAGLERVVAARQGNTSNSNLTPGAAAAPPGSSGYFDQSGQPFMGRERSTVGSASATGSIGGHMTWASGSDMYEPDKMSDTQDMEMDTSSVGGMSDEQNSLVGFGEGARTPARQSAYGSPSVSKATPTGPPPHFGMREASMTPVGAQTISEQQYARGIDGQTHDDYDTSDRFSRAGGASAEAERYMKDRLGDTGNMGAPDVGNGDLGRFDFERK